MRCLPGCDRVDGAKKRGNQDWPERVGYRMKVRRERFDERDSADQPRIKLMKTLRVFVGMLLCSMLVSSAFAADARTKPAKPEKIAHGSEVAITDYLVEGKTVIFDFTSEYCPPCRAIAPKLDALHAAREDIVVVKVDINRPEHKGIDWKSPVARQYQLQSVPHFKVYGPDGKLVAEGKEASKMVYGMLPQE